MLLYILFTLTLLNNLAPLIHNFFKYGHNYTSLLDKLRSFFCCLNAKDIWDNVK